MTTIKEFQKEILESLDILGEKINKSDNINGKDEAYKAYKKAKKLLQ